MTKKSKNIGTSAEQNRESLNRLEGPPLGQDSNDAENSTQSDKKFSLQSLAPSHQRALLTKFAETLRSELATKSGEQGGDVLRRKVMSEISKEAKTQGIFAGEIGTYHFEGFLRHLHRDGLLPVGSYRFIRAQETLKKTPWGKDVDIVVVSGNDSDLFFRAAAEDFVEQLFRIVKEKKSAFETGSGDRKPIEVNVGLVSGSTVGGTIRKALEIPWKTDLRKDARALLSETTINVLALNVCLTVAPHLSNNAGVLAQALAKKIYDEVTQTKGPDDADQTRVARAFGLSAPLLVDKARLREVDLAPQTREVVSFTEPYRIADEDSLMETKGKMNSTKLDIVLSGLGELPSEKVGGSIFYKLAKDFQFKMDELVENEHIVGDLAFTAINASGKPVPLRKHLGSPRLEEDDIRDIGALIEELNRPSHAVSEYLREKLLSVNKEYSKSQRISSKELVEFLNTIIEDQNILRGDLFKKIHLSDQTRYLLSFSSEDNLLLNRLLLESAYPFLIAKLNTEYLFYSAVQLGVLSEMAKDKNKSVILLARWEPKKQKVPAIYASVAFPDRYASRLVIDEPTAHALILLSPETRELYLDEGHASHLTED